jgi:hypothetical protein
MPVVGWMRIFPYFGPPAGSVEMGLAESIDVALCLPSRVSFVVSYVRAGFNHAEWHTWAERRIAPAIHAKHWIDMAGQLSKGAARDR